MIWWMMANFMTFKICWTRKSPISNLQVFKTNLCCSVELEKKNKKTKPPTSPTLQVLNPTDVLNTWQKKNTADQSWGKSSITHLDPSKVLLQYRHPYQAYCCVQISREKKTEKILITSCQLCWAWYLEDHPLDAAWHIRQLLLAHN